MKIPTFLFKAFSKLDPLEIATNELLNARLELLRAESSVEYSLAIVEYNKKRIKRLEAYLEKVTIGVANG